MPTDTQLTGGTCPLMISGQEFRARPFTDRDYAELDEYVQNQIIQTARRACKGLSLEERKEVTSAAISASIGVRWNGEEGGRIFFRTPSGQAYLVWSMIKANNRITFEEFQKLFLTVEYYDENSEEAFRVFDKLNFLPEEERSETSTNESNKEEKN